MKERIKHIFSFVNNSFEKTILLIITVFPLLIVAGFYSGKVSKAPVREDAVGYYAYLPATLIHQDLKFSSLIKEDAPYSGGANTFEREYNSEEAKILGFNQLDNGSFLDKYPVGVAVLLAPFYILGHIFTIIFGGQTTGWSFFYQYFSFYGGVTYFLLGILFLRRILQKYFSLRITHYTLLIIIFGTNLFNYAFYENIFSHIYSFFLIALLIYLTPKWLKKTNVRNSGLIGVIGGLIVLVRFTNIIVFLIPLLYGINSATALKDRLQHFWNTRLYLLVSVASAFICFIPQLIYWKVASGTWFVFGYQDEGFNFLAPKLFEVLLGTSKGLFFWTPVLLLAIPGFVLLKRKARNYVLPFIIILILQTFLVASWWNWEYGWSFGHRGFTDFFPIFAIGIASFLTSIKDKRSRIIVGAVSVLLVLLSLFQMIQYWVRILPPARTTWTDYKKMFLRLDRNLVRFWKDYFMEE